MAGIRILQCNVGRRKVAMDLICEEAVQKNIDIVLLQEPNKFLAESQGWFLDESKNVAIKSFSPVQKINEVYKENYGFVVAVTEECSLVSCYISPNCKMEEFKTYLTSLERIIRKQTKHCIIGGDFNAKSTVWASRTNDKRGEYLLEWMAELNLVILNRGDKATFDNGRHTSIIDITFCTEKIVKSVVGWQVLEDESLSDHKYLFYEINIKKQQIFENQKKHHTGWRVDRLEDFRTLFYLNVKAWKGEERNSIITPRVLIEMIVNACNNTLSKRIVRKRRKPNYWWTAALTGLRASCLRAKRILTRRRQRNSSDIAGLLELENIYKRNRQVYKNAIIKAKQAAWEGIRENIEMDPWGLAYKIVLGKLKNPNILKLTEDRQMDIVNELFPVGESKADFPVNDINIYTPLFTKAELIDATEKIKNGKAAGPDKLSPEIVKAAVQEDPDLIVNLMNYLLQRGVFPDVWKVAKVVLLEKPNRPQKPLTYRPICLIDVMGKLYEHLIAARLSEELETKNLLFKHQYGFRRKRSTLDAMQAIVDIASKITSKAAQNREFCLLITLDIKNAFNTASWNGIMRELEVKGISAYLRRVINDYLNDRKLLVGETGVRAMTCGVPQGSVLGPILWNIYYDSVLCVEVPAGTHIIGYADDTAVVVTAKSVKQLVSNANTTLCWLSDEIKMKGLRLAAEKTEALILYGGRNLTKLKITVDNFEVETKTSLKYLGVTFDRNLRMTEHVKICCIKAERTAMALSRLMPNQNGPKMSVRRTLSSVVHSIILYAVPIWEKAMKFEKYREMVKKVQRRMAVRICSAFKTISTEAALAIASTPPIQLLAEDRTQRYLGQTFDDSIYERWQSIWVTETGKAGWTKRLITDLVPWCTRKHGEVDYYLSQILSGHGWFGSYQRRFHQNQQSLCIVCNVEDTVEHAFFECEEWKNLRDDLNLKLGCIIHPGNLIKLMLESQENWKDVAQLAAKILKIKEDRITRG